MKKIILGFLLSAQVWAGFDFGECSGSGTFEQNIAHYRGDYEKTVNVGEIPAGIKGLHIELISDNDVDIRLYAENNEKIIHWPLGVLHSPMTQSASYEGVAISYSGYNGTNGKRGHEYVEINATTPTAMTMKAFGYRAGYATVNYSWIGKEGCSETNKGTGTFTQAIKNKETTLVGTIPPHLENIEILLSSDKDLDIQLYGVDGTAIVSWKPQGLLFGANKQRISYHGMTIEWSGYNGVNASKGHEYIKITGKTTEQLVMKVYGYQAGSAEVNYTWGNTIDLVNKYGLVTQGTLKDSKYNYYGDPAYATDHNDKSYNHTRDNDENWIQVKFPVNATVSDLRIHNANQAWRLGDAKVYISNTAHETGTVLDETTAVATLTGTSGVQDVHFDTAKVGRYLLIKAKTGSHLHIGSLEAFGKIDSSITEYTSVDLANRYGVATQGTLANTGYHYYHPADRVLDKNSNTSNHTRDNEENWVQIALPTKANIAKFMIKGGNASSAYRLNAAHVYLRNTPYKNGDVLDSNDSVATLLGTTAEQVIELEEHIQAKYLLVKAKLGYNVHLTNIEMYGVIDDSVNESLTLDLAHAYGFARQGTTANSGYHYYGAADKVIDNNDKTYNHTRDNNESWVEIEFPSAVNINKIMVHGANVAWRLDQAQVYVRNTPYQTNEALDITDAVSILKGTLSKQWFEFEEGKHGKYLLIRANANNRNLHFTAIEAYGYLPQMTCSTDTDCDGVCDTTGETDTCAVANICGNGVIESTEVCDDGNVFSNDGCSALCEVEETTTAFMTNATTFNVASNVDSLVNSYLSYAHKEAQASYGSFIDEAVSTEIWEEIKNTPSVKEGLYAAQFPINPHFVKNYADFITQWKADGKSDDFIDKYRNVALGLAINARNAGIFDELRFGDTSEHVTVDYRKEKEYILGEAHWLENFNFNTGIEGISYGAVSGFMSIKYDLAYTEVKDLWYSQGPLKAIKDAGYTVDQITPEIREEYDLSYGAYNVFRLASGLERADCYAKGNPCEKVESFIASENNATLTKSYVVSHYGTYKTQLGLVYPSAYIETYLRGELGIISADQNTYKLMSMYDLANWKIANDNIPAQTFQDGNPNWPLFDAPLSTLPWQLLALTQGAQKKECAYVRDRFFETDKAKLRASYPPNAVGSVATSESRFVQYTTYTWGYREPEVNYRESDWSTSSVYRIMQDGGVCGRQSTMGQHVNECLNRPSIGVGQPGHRAWVGVYHSGIEGQYKTGIGYQVGTRESATAHSELIYNHYTGSIRKTGMERFTGVATGVSPASAGEHVYNQSMILQHIGKILEEKGNSAEAVLRKSVELAPQNVDAWYQLALYFAAQDEPEKIIALATEFMEKRDTFFLDQDTYTGASNMEIITGKNIAFTITKAASIDGGKGEKGAWGLEALKTYLNTYESERRSMRSDRDLNRYIRQYFIEKEHNEAGFSEALCEVLTRRIDNSSSGELGNFYSGVSFNDVNKEEIFDALQYVIDISNISDASREIYTRVLLGRVLSTPLAEMHVSDVCMDKNLETCQSMLEVELDSKSVYLTSSTTVGPDKEIAVSLYGKDGYSILTVPVIDANDNDLDIKIRIAKVATTNGVSGKLLKMNDPTIVDTEKTKIIVWIDPDDNNLDSAAIYRSLQKIVITVKNRVENNEETMGSIFISVNDLIRGRSVSFGNEGFTSKAFDASASSIFYTALDSAVGPTAGLWARWGVTPLNVTVYDENNQAIAMTLNAQNGAKFMHSAYTVGGTSALTIDYTSEDNPSLVSGKRYKTQKPFVINVRQWHIGKKIIDRLYVNMDFIAK